MLHDLVSQDDAQEVQRILAQLAQGQHPAFVPKTSPGSSAGAHTPLHHLQQHGAQDVLTANSSAAAATPFRELGQQQPALPPMALALGTALAPRRRTSSTSSKRKRAASPTPYHELVDLLVNTSHDAAHTIVQRLRHTGDVSTVLGQAREADLLLQLRMVPETRRRYDLPLRNDMPDFLLTLDNPYLESLIHESYFSRRSVSLSAASSASSSAVAARHAGFNDNIVHYVTPFGSGKLHEPILDEIRPSEWTTVLKDDVVLRRLLRSYFLYDYQNYPAFHKDLFLQDMRSRRTRFCSPLLVNAVLAAGCHADGGVPNSDRFWLPQGLAYRFLAEAKRLWEMEDHGVSKLTTMQAAIILNAISLTDATDKIGKAFHNQAVAMALDMKLMTTRDQEIQGSSMRKARAFTAWCLFAWDVIQSFFFFKRPTFPAPPLQTLPDATDQAWYGEIWLRYPGDQLVPTHAGAVFRASMGMRLIQHALSLAFFELPEGAPGPSAHAVQDFLDQLYRWFDALPECVSPKNTVLPVHLRLHMEYYTALISVARVMPTSEGSAVEPFKQPRPELENQSGTRTPRPRSAVEDPMAHALVCLETLVRIYQMRHGINFYDSSMCYYFAFMGTCILQALSEYYVALAASASSTAVDAPSTDLPSRARLDAYRSALIMCAKGLHENGKSSYVCQVTYYILRGSMPPRERDMVLGYIKEHSAADSQTSSGLDDSAHEGDGDDDEPQDLDDGDSSDHRGGPRLRGGGGSGSGGRKTRAKREEEEDTLEMRIHKYNQSQFPMPIISIAEDPRDHTLTELAGRYRRMSLGERSESSKSAAGEEQDAESPVSD